VLKNSLGMGQFPSAAKASIQKKRLIAAVNRCATQKQAQKRRTAAPPKSRDKVEFFSKL
jgi:hypothetical protein